MTAIIPEFHNAKPSRYREKPIEAIEAEFDSRCARIEKRLDSIRRDLMWLKVCDVAFIAYGLGILAFWLM